MKRARELTPFAFIAFLLVSSCSSTPSSQGQTGLTSPETKATLATTSASLPEQEELTNAAKLYAKIVTPVNCSIDAYRAIEQRYSLGNNQVDMSGLPEFVASFAERASLRQTAIEQLVRATWPERVRGDLDSLALFWAGVQKSEVAVSKSTDIGSWNASASTYSQLLAAPDAGVSKIIRIKLDLPEFSATDCQ